jgi:hypothetical protein
MLHSQQFFLPTSHQKTLPVYAELSQLENLYKKLECEIEKQLEFVSHLAQGPLWS